MNEIEISVKDLYEKAKMMLDDGMDTVLIRFLESGGENGRPCISFEASSENESDFGVDYEEIEEISD